MRQAYHLGLAQLDRESADMCIVAGNCLRDATQALLSADLALAEQVISSVTLLAPFRGTAENRVMELLTLQAPVAADLRTVVAALWNVADLTRMGTLAGHVARSARRRHPKAVVPPAVRPIIERMGRLAVQLADQTGLVLRDRDIALARALNAQDVLLDNQQRAMFAAVLAPSWSHGVEAAVDAALLSRFYERFADHAVSVAGRVVFLVTGDHSSVLPAAANSAVGPIRSFPTRPSGRAAT